MYIVWIVWNNEMDENIREYNLLISNYKLLYFVYQLNYKLIN